jgi:hypothetical protein
LVFENGALDFIYHHLCPLPLLPARKVGKQVAPVGRKGPGPWGCGLWAIPVVVGRPARPSKLKNQARDSCPEAHCPEVQCPDFNTRVGLPGGL